MHPRSPSSATRARARASRAWRGAAAVAALLAACTSGEGGGGGGDVAPPSTASNVVATATGPTSIDLTWTASTDDVGVTSYEVRRGGTLVATVSGPAATDASAQPGTEQCYTVVARDAAGNASAPSAPACATTPVVDVTAPTTPIGLVAISVAVGRIDLSWNPSSDDVGVAGYTILRDGTALATSSEPSHSDLTVVDGTHYCYAVSAFDAAGNVSDPGDAVCADAPLPPDVTPPSVPTGLVATVVSLGQVDLSWNASTDDRGGVTYSVRRDEAPTWYMTPASWSDLTVSPGATYCYTVAARDEALNSSDWSAPACATVDLSPPTAPTRLEAVAAASEIDLAWWSSTDDTSVAHYEITRDGAVAATSTSPAWADTATAPGPRRCYTVVAVDVAGKRSDPSAKACVQSWPRRYGGAGSDGARALAPTGDGGWVLAGFTSSSGAGDSDAFLLRLDPDGVASWQVTYGEGAYDRAESVQQTSDGGFAVFGWSDSSGAGLSDYFLVKTDASGGVTWQKRYGGADYDRGYSMQQTSDGGYVMAGYTFPAPARVAVVRADANGDPLWATTIAAPADTAEVGHAIRQTSDGGFVVAAGPSGRLVKLDADGNVTWARRLGDPTASYVYDVRQLADDGYIVVAFEYDHESSGRWYGATHLIRTDAAGDVVWDKAIDAPFWWISLGEYELWSVAVAPGGGYVVAGRKHVEIASGFARWGSIVKTDANGDVEWRSQDLWGDLHAVAPALGGGYVAAGWTSAFGAFDLDVYAVKVDASGAIP